MEKDLSKPDMPKEDWGYYEDEFGDEEPPDKSDQSDDDFEDYSSKKKKGKGKATKAKGVSEIHIDAVCLCWKGLVELGYLFSTTTTNSPDA